MCGDNWALLPCTPNHKTVPHLGTGGGLSTSVQSHHHDDVGFPLDWVPHRRTRVHQLTELTNQ